MNFESTLSNGDDLVKSPDTSTIPDTDLTDTDLTDTTPITSVDADDGKTTVIVVQAPAAESSEEQSVDAAAEGEEVSAAGALLTTSVDPHTEDSTGLPGVVKSVFGEYHPRTQTVTETLADGTVLTSTECVPGLAGLDWYWISGVFMFGLILWSFFRFLGGVLKS